MWNNPALPGAFALTMSVLILGACDPDRDATPTNDANDAATPSPYLYIWAGDSDRGEGDTDFLSVVDVNPESSSYGTVLETAPVGSVGNGPHHAEPVAPSDGLLLANGFGGDRTFLFDLTAPAAPVHAGELELMPGYNFLHSFLRMENGHVLATAQEGGRDNSATVGGIVEFDRNGVFVQAGSAAQADYDTIRPYAIEVFPGIDRLLSSSFSMKLERSDNLIQLWRLSDLTLLKTVAVPQIPPANQPTCYMEALVSGGDCTVDRIPGSDRTFEIRALHDGSALLNTLACGFYRITGLESDEPEIEVVMNLSDEWGCGVPTVMGNYYVIAVEFSNRLATLDVSDPANVVEVASVDLGDGFMPHWSSGDPGSNRIVVTGDAPDGSLVHIYRLDSETGELTRDETFATFTMDRDKWPHGATGPAAPHAALFGGFD